MYIFLNNSVYFFTFLETKGRNKHRGALLEATVKDSGYTISSIVKRLGISRGTYYNNIADPHLSYEQLAKYGKVIGHDFSAVLPEMKRLTVEEPEAVYQPPRSLEEAIEQRDYWREKYYQLMEKYNTLLENKP